MSVVVVGLNHRTVPLALLERVTIDDARLPKALHDVLSQDHVSEAVVLSTCNRTEVYVVAEKFHPAYGDLRTFFSELAFADPEELAGHLYVHDADAAAGHLFRVASGIDSAVVGEAEILGQVRRAWDIAQTENAAGSQLNLLFRHALEVGKRARTETGIGRHVASVSTAAVAMAAQHLGSLEGRSILVMGAGEMGEGMVRALASNGVSDIRIANRTWENAADLAERLGGTAIRLADLDAALSEVDLLLTGTGANSMIIEHADIERVMRARGEREILVVDVAVPRDVDPAAADIPMASNPAAFSSLVAMLPRNPENKMSGRSDASCAFRRIDPVATCPPCGNPSMVDPTRTSRTSPRAGTAAITSSSGVSAGRSLPECTAKSARPSSTAAWISFTKTPLPPMASIGMSRR